MKWWEWPYGRDNYTANLLNRATNYDRNPLSQYYRFPWESLLASPDPVTYKWSLICIGCFAMTPLLAMVPFIWLMTQIITGVFWGVLLITGAAAGGRTGLIDLCSLPRWTNVSTVVIIATGAVLPFLWTASIMRALHLFG